MEIQKRNIDYKLFIIIGLAMVLAITIFISLNSTDRSKDKYESKIAILTDSIHTMQGRLDVYKVDEKELLDQLFVKQEEINNQRVIINKLKKKLDEKTDSVYNLNDKQSLEFLSNWLSKRNNLR